MNLSTRLTYLEKQANANTTEHTGKPVMPLNMTSEQYEQAIQSKRKELGLKPTDVLPILAL